MGNSYQKTDQIIWIDHNNIQKFPYRYNKILRASGSTKQEALNNLSKKCKNRGLLIPIKDKETGHFYCGQIEISKCFKPTEIWKNTVLFYKGERTYFAEIFL